MKRRPGEGPEGAWLLWVSWVGKHLPACLWNGTWSKWKGGCLQLLRWGQGKQMCLLIDLGIQGPLQPPQAQWPLVLIVRSTYQISVCLKQHHLADGVAEPMEYVNREFLSHLLLTFLFLLLPLAVVCSLLCKSWCPGLCQSFGKREGAVEDTTLASRTLIIQPEVKETGPWLGPCARQVHRKCWLNE